MLHEHKLKDKKLGRGTTKSQALESVRSFEGPSERERMQFVEEAKIRLQREWIPPQILPHLELSTFAAKLGSEMANKLPALWDLVRKGDF